MEQVLQHALDRELDSTLGVLVEQLLQARGLQIAQVARVVVIELVGHLLTGHSNLASVDDHDVIAGVDVRRVGGFVLAAQTHGGAGKEPSERLVGRVDQVPITTYRSRIREDGSH